MRKIIALLLALLSVLMCFASCSNTPDMTDTADTNKPSYINPTSVEEKLISSKLAATYNSFYYYIGRVNANEPGSDTTIKFQNLRNLYDEGVQLYNDPLGDEDPFRQNLPNLQMLVDEEASAENGGMPVLIIGIRYAKIDLEGDNRILLYRIVSYNTASGKLTTLAEEVEELKDFYLYKNKLYCVGRTWDYTNPEEPERVYNVLMMDKDGKNKKEYVLEEKNVCPYLIGVYKGKMYFSQNHNILRSDLDFENSEIIIDDIKCNFTPVFAGGYMYYQGNNRDIEVDSYTVKNCRDLLRRPLSDILNKESEEVVLEGIYRFMRYQINLYTYCTINEIQIINKNDKKTISHSCTHIFDIYTGASKLLFDFRDTNTDQTYFVSFLSEEFYVRQSSGAVIVVNIKTGEEIDATGIFD